MQENKHTLHVRSGSLCECSVSLGHHDASTVWPHNLSATSRSRHPVMCIAQRHNKQACQLVLHIIHILLSAKLPSNECYCLKSVGMTRQGKKPQDHQLPSPCSNYRAGKYMLHFKRYCINNLAQKARDIVDRTLMINLLLSAIQILLLR